MSQYTCLGQPKDSGVGELFCCIHLRNKNQVPFMARGIKSGIPSEGPFELGASLDGGAAGRESSFASVDKGVLQRNQHTPKMLLCGQTF